MKEYLFKNSFGGYTQVDPELVARVIPLKHLVEIPEGAEVAVRYENKEASCYGQVFFWKDDGEKCWYCDTNRWADCEKELVTTLSHFKAMWAGKCSVIWEREKQQEATTSEDDYLLTKTPFTYDRLLGCYVEHYASCSNSGYIVSVGHNTTGELVFEVEGAEWNYGILAKEVIFYTEDNQPLSFEQYKEMYYGATYNEETSK